MRVYATALALLASMSASPVQEPVPPVVDALHRPLDQILDIYVRDGLVYYNALKQERPRFDRYLASVSAVSAAELAGWSSERQRAYWINAYNAFVLRTVIDHYPIRGRSAEYPANSIRQIAGAFERTTHRAGGRLLTLDTLEREVIGGFGDARALLALSRGAMGGPRLKSEAFSSSRLEAQLKTMTAELVDRRELVHVDIPGGTLRVSPLFSWREDLFTSLWAGKARSVFTSRSALERAVLALIEPMVVPTEAAFLQENTFQMAFIEFDWRLNDLTGR